MDTDGPEAQLSAYSPSHSEHEGSAQEEYEKHEENKSASIARTSSKEIRVDVDHSPTNTETDVLERITSLVSVNDVSKIPNGGVRAWLQVLGSFMLFFNNWGIINAFGAYQTFYETGTLFVESPSSISWIGAIQAFLLMLVGAVTGSCYDAGYFRTLLWSGSFLIVLGQMMLSLCTQYWQAILAQAICVGIGAGLVFVPSVAILSTYFSSRMSFAIGIAASGSSVGGVLYPIVFFRLEPTIGFAWATRVIGFMSLASLAIPLAVMRVRVLPSKKRALLDLSAFKELPYVLYTVGTMIGFVGLFIPFFYIQYYAIRQHAMSPSLAFYQLAILNSGGVLGRTVPNFLADRTGPLNMLVPCAWFAALLCLCMLAIHSAAGIMVFAGFYGFFSGTFVSLSAPVYVSLSPNPGVVGTRIGMGFSLFSLGLLSGTPAAGAILGYRGVLDFRGLWLFAGVLVLLSAVLVTSARFVRERRMFARV